jgi:pyruvate dehydrogenase E2 component (dihydrolipoamide acetyltransferase)
MPINILMPALSPTMEKGNLAKWLKKEGDKVKTGDILAEIETDKATMEYEAVDDGTLAKILVPEGSADIAVNQPIAILATEGEDVKAAASAGGAAPAKAAAPAAAPAPAPSPAARPAVAAAPSPVATPPAAKAPAAAPSASPAPSTNGHGRIFASPLARRLAKTAGIDIGRVPGTGPHGRIIARDVEAAKSGGVALRTPAAPGAGVAAPAPVLAPSDDKIRALFEPGSYEIVPHDNMRKIIAQRLVLAKQTIPHFYLTVTCTIDKLLEAREDINATAPKGADGKPAYKLSVNDFVIKAMAMALMKVPDANVTWTESGMLKHKHADIGVAVAIPGGLITPVIRKAETKSLTVISREMKDYAARARTRRLKPEEYQGGTTAISNLGMYGIEEFAAVINPPHATILAVGTGEQRPVVRDGKLAIATQMTVTLSTDHRAVDGALGAELIGAFRTFVESPTMMLV